MMNDLTYMLRASFIMRDYESELHAFTNDTKVLLLNTITCRGWLLPQVQSIPQPSINRRYISFQDSRLEMQMFRFHYMLLVWPSRVWCNWYDMAHESSVSRTSKKLWQQFIPRIWRLSMASIIMPARGSVSSADELRKSADPMSARLNVCHTIGYASAQGIIRKEVLWGKSLVIKTSHVSGWALAYGGEYTLSESNIRALIFDE